MKQLLIVETRLHAFWAARNTRERLILAAGGIIAIVAFYLMAVGSINKRIQVLQRRLPQLTLDSYEIATGSKALPQRARRAGDLRSDLFKILAEHKLQADLRVVSTSQVEMRLPDQDARTLINTLNTIRLAADAHIVSLQLRAVDPQNAGATAMLERAP